MKILYLTTFELNQGGGAGRVAFEMVTAAKNKGLEVGVMYPADKTETFVRDGIVHITIQSVSDKDATFPKVTLTDYFHIAKYIEKFNPDLIHSHSEVMVGLIGAVWGITHGKHIVLTCHMMPTRIREWNVMSSGSAHVMEFLHMTGLTEAVLMDYYKNCSVLIALNDSVYEAIVEFGYKGEIWKIPNGRNLASFLNLEIPKIDKEINLVFAGHINDRKNQKFLIEMMEFLPQNYRLSLLGDFPDEDSKREINDLILSKGLKNVRILGSLPFNQVPSILEGSHIFVSASKAEVQSLAVMEALAAGKPIVGIENETINEFVDFSNGIKLPTDVSHKDYAQAVVDITNNPSKYLAMSSSSRNKIRNYDWSTILDLTIRKYKDLLSRPVKPASPNILESLIRVFPPHIQEQIASFRKTVNLERNKNPNPKKLQLSTVGIVGVSLAGSIVAYTLLKGFFGKSKTKSKEVTK
jgi:1,2-diacylglycerol 3-alpha-glucosyltransferase